MDGEPHSTIRPFCTARIVSCLLISSCLPAVWSQRTSSLSAHVQIWAVYHVSTPNHLTRSDGPVRISFCTTRLLYGHWTLRLTSFISGRRKKKKCDLAKPVCMRCRKSTGSVVCEWPAHAPGSEDGGRYHPRLDIEPRRGPIPMLMNSESQPQTTMVLRDSGRVSNHGTLPPDSAGHGWEAPSPHNSIENCITLSLPTGVKKVSPYVLYNNIPNLRVL
jgi:hypothetical protein